MGGRGAFLESGGFEGPLLWKGNNEIDGVKVLELIDPRKRTSLPERSNTPETAYISLDREGSFKQLRVFDQNRMPLFDIDTNEVDHIPTLHIHYYVDGQRQRTHMPVPEHLIQKYRNIIYHGTPHFIKILTGPVG